MKKTGWFWRSLLHWCMVMLLPGAVAAATAAESRSAQLPVSRISVIGQVDQSAVQAKLRKTLAASISNDWRETKRELNLGILGRLGAVIRYRTRADKLTFTADGRGNLRLRIPITVDPQPNSSGLASLGVWTDGCKQTNFQLDVRFVAKVSGERLTITQKKLSANSGRYLCAMRPNAAGTVFTFGQAKSVDIAGQVRSAIERKAKPLFSGAVGQLNRMLAVSDKLSELARQPAVFGSGVRLGIEFHRFLPKRLYGDGGLLKLEGVVEGRPWLDFGGGAGRAPKPTGAEVAEEEFQLPAVLLFPTSPKLLPAVQTVASTAGGPSGFSLQPVPDRKDLAVLQREADGARENVIWLSGGAMPDAPKTLYFEQPLTGMLDQILDWLNEPELWRDVSGVEALKAEVASFRRLVEYFQQETRLPLDDRGELHFSRLSLDLLSVRVSGEAIWADVVLRGQARLEIRFDL